MATSNIGKLREISALLSNFDVEIVAQSAYQVVPAEETGDTFASNALQKARNASRQTGLAAIADDSGLVVDALDGLPGVGSARYAGLNATDRKTSTSFLKRCKTLKIAMLIFIVPLCSFETRKTLAPSSRKQPGVGKLAKLNGGQAVLVMIPFFLIRS